MGQPLSPGPRPRPGARYIFQLDTVTPGGVIRILDTETESVFREIPVRDFVEFARTHRHVKRFLLGEVS